MDWTTGQTRPYISLGTYGIINDFINANAVVDKVKRVKVILKFGLKGNIKKIKLAAMNDFLFW